MADINVNTNSETKIEATTDTGKTIPVSGPELTKLLLDNMRVVEVTVSVREGRQHAQYLGTERFVSGKVDLADAWDLMPTNATPEQRAAFGDAMTQRIMKLESYLYERIVHMQKKNNLLTFPRDANNPWVKEGWNYSAALAQSKTAS
jgi:hypothetical protein